MGSKFSGLGLVVFRYQYHWHGGHGGQQDTAVVFDQPAATTAATKIQVGPNSVAVWRQFKYVGRIVQADGGQDKELQRLCSGGQVLRSLSATLSVLLQEYGAGFHAQGL